MAEIKGVDLSVHNGSVDMEQIKASGMEFVMLRAGYGRELRQKDSRFEENYVRAKAAGLPVGAYWYSYAKDAEGARLEADCCAQVLAGKQFEYPVAFDLEDASQKELGRDVLTEMAVTFCSRLEELGYYVMLYASLDWLRNKLDYSRISRFDIWLAQWRNGGHTYENPVGMWQYTSDGEIPGSSARTDCNVSYRDYPAIIRASGRNGWDGGVPQPAPEPAPAPAEYPEPARLLIQGCEGDDVKWVQQHLAQQGYDIGSTGIDGKYGPTTTAAVKAFQRGCGLAVDGKAGPLTICALRGGNPHAKPQRDLFSGSAGEDVKWVQYALRQRGYSVGGAGIDGKYGGDTQAAVRAYQWDNGLVVDGVAGPATRAALEG